MTTMANGLNGFSRVPCRSVPGSERAEFKTIRFPRLLADHFTTVLVLPIQHKAKDFLSSFMENGLRFRVMPCKEIA